MLEAGPELNERFRVEELRDDGTLTVQWYRDAQRGVYEMEMDGHIVIRVDFSHWKEGEIPRER